MIHPQLTVSGDYSFYVIELNMKTTFKYIFHGTKKRTNRQS
jgi:hypothetical protein